MDKDVRSVPPLAPFSALIHTALLAPSVPVNSSQQQQQQQLYQLSSPNLTMTSTAVQSQHQLQPPAIAVTSPDDIGGDDSGGGGSGSHPYLPFLRKGCLITIAPDDLVSLSARVLETRVAALTMWESKAVGGPVSSTGFVSPSTPFGAVALCGTRRSLRVSIGDTVEFCLKPRSLSSGSGSGSTAHGNSGHADESSGSSDLHWGVVTRITFAATGPECRTIGQKMVRVTVFPDTPQPRTNAPSIGSAGLTECVTHMISPGRICRVVSRVAELSTSEVARLRGFFQRNDGCYRNCFVEWGTWTSPQRSEYCARCTASDLIAIAGITSPTEAQVNECLEKARILVAAAQANVREVNNSRGGATDPAPKRRRQKSPSPTPTLIPTPPQTLSQLSNTAALASAAATMTAASTLSQLVCPQPLATVPLPSPLSLSVPNVQRAPFFPAGAAASLPVLLDPSPSVDGRQSPPSLTALAVLVSPQSQPSAPVTSASTPGAFQLQPPCGDSPLFAASCSTGVATPASAQHSPPFEGSHSPLGGSAAVPGLTLAPFMFDEPQGKRRKSDEAPAKLPPQPRHEEDSGTYNELAKTLREEAVAREEALRADADRRVEEVRASLTAEIARLEQQLSVISNKTAN